MNKQVFKNKGFSLVELLIAIAILSIIMVMISSFITTTLNSNNKAKREIQVQEEAQRIYYQISDLIMQASYIRVTTADGTAYVYDKANGC